jgi:pimeloyl-ACP methyl ester carboxylesterase
MQTVTSKDGTIIAFDQNGTGTPLIMVNGALGFRALDTIMPHVDPTALLGEHFTVINYDRRGRGDSTNTLPFAVQREIEDIEALIDHAGGAAYLYGVSSGAALAMEAAIRLGSQKVTKLAMYEMPVNDDLQAQEGWRKYRQDINELIAAGRNDAAVIRFMTLVGMPPEDAEGVKQMPLWDVFESAAPTLAYDAAVLGENSTIPTDRARLVTVPALAAAGSASYPFMDVAAKALAYAMPHGQHRTLEGQTHEVAADVIAPVLIDFLNS